MANENGTYILTEEEKDTLVEREAFDQGTKVAQIFSGIFFFGVAAWLTVSNGTKLAFVQRAALEKRLTVCCFLNTYVAFFSTFFNFFQLTAVDDAVLPEAGNFTLDLARPFEWIMTCPLMQLSLVLMGGAKLPEYRRYLMPGFSATILLLGTFGALFGDQIFALKVVAFILGCLLFAAMVYFNRLQIIEYSNGEEGLISGDSEFRKATLMLIATWSPFPMWYIISPEGLGLLDNVLIIQLGWAFLNIVAKFSFIFYIQRVKDMYCNRLKTKRELQPGKVGFGSGGGQRPGSCSPPGDMEYGGAMGPGYMTAQELELAEAEKKKAQLSAVVVETMTFLGMAQHTERFLKLLERANMNSIYDVEVLTKDTAAPLQLPWELVSALQRRLRVWKLEMVDDAEVGLDKGEEYYIKKGCDMPPMDMDLQQGMPCMPGMVPMSYQQNEDQSAKLAEIEELLRQKLKSEETILTESRSQGNLLDKSVEGMLNRVQSAMEAMERRILSRLEGGSGSFDFSSKDLATQRSEVRAFETRITAKLDELQTITEQQRRHELHTLETRVVSTVQQQVALLTTKVDVCCQKAEANGQKVDACCQKVVSTGAEQMNRSQESASKLAEKVDESMRSCQSGLEALKTRVEGSFAQLGGQTQSLLEKADAATAQTRSGIDALSQKVEAMQSSQAKHFVALEDVWRQRLGELETGMAEREIEREASDRRRFEELLRSSSLRKVEELGAQLQKMSEETGQGMATLGSTLTSEVQAAAGHVSQKTEALQGSLARQLSESEGSTTRRLDETVAQIQQMAAQVTARIDTVDIAMQRRSEASAEMVSQSSQELESAVWKGLESLGVNVQQSTDKAFGKTAAALDGLEKTLQRRWEESVSKCAAEAAQVGASTADRRTEKALEALESGHRTDLRAATESILEGINDISSLQARKAGEREDRSMRRLEELLEISTNRIAQKAEDVGVEVKKELHGFAKRLNSKIPFM